MFQLIRVTKQIITIFLLKSRAFQLFSKEIF